MEIIMCIKPVRSSLVYQDSNRNDVITMNPYDLLALKDILARKKNTDCKVTCLSMGAPSTEEVLVRCMAMGADDAILLCDEAFGGADTVATTYVLSVAMEKINNYQVIVCGNQSVDGETGQVVYGLAERLQLPCIANVHKIVELKEDTIVLEIISEDYISTVEVKTPVVISYHDFTIVRENVSLMSLRKAERKGITIWNKEDIGIDREKCGLKGSKTKVLDIQTELVKKSNGIVVEGTSCDKAEVIFSVIMSKNVIKNKEAIKSEEAIKNEDIIMNKDEKELVECYE
jgi:electron transfer flavoprotein beta subunit